MARRKTAAEEEVVEEQNAQDVLAALAGADEEVLNEASAPEPQVGNSKKGPTVLEVQLERGGEVIGTIRHIHGEVAARAGDWISPESTSQVDLILHSAVYVPGKAEDDPRVEINPQLNGREFVRRLPEANIGFGIVATKFYEY